MAEITINDADLQAVQGKVVLMTAPSSSNSYTYIRTNVVEWSDLVSLFKETLSLHGHIDHVFANAGMRPVASYLALEEDSSGDPVEPNHITLDVNLKGVINTASLGLHYMQKQPPPKQGNHSIVVTASPSAYHRFRAADYGISKHGVLGLLRGLTPVTYPDLPIRVNALCPGWTATALVEQAMYAGVNVNLSTAENVAKAAVLLMADESRHGQMVLSVGDRYREVEEAVLLKAMSSEVRGQELSEDEICAGVIGNMMKAQQ
ncbi:NAD(P)-binding protein, partial [Aureobasidium melanogenum]